MWLDFRPLVQFAARAQWFSHATKLDSDYSWAVGLTPNNFLFISSLREAFSSGGREIWHELGVKVCPR